MIKLFSIFSCTLCILLFISEKALCTEKPNLLGKIENVSFEAGLRGSTLTEFDEVTTIKPIFSTFATNGNRGLQIDEKQVWTTKMISVIPGQKYQLSFDIRTLDTDQHNFITTCQTTFIGKGIERPIYTKNISIANHKWQRMTIPVEIPKNSIPWFFFQIRVPEQTNHGSIIIDAVRFSEISDNDNSLPYISRYPIEASIETPKSLNDFSNAQESINMELKLSSKSNANVVIKDILYNNEYYPKLLPSAFGYKLNLVLPIGIFLLDASIITPEGTFHIYKTISVVNKRNITPHKNPAKIGAHFTMRPLEIARAHRLGFETLNYLNNKTYWNIVEPQPHKFIFPADEDINKASNEGFEIIAHLSYPVQNPPSWIHSIPTKSGDWGWQRLIPKEDEMSYWKEYVYTMAKHYQKTVRHWEIISEANGAMQPDDYIPMLKAAYEAIKSVDPDIEVIAFGSTWGNKYKDFQFIEKSLKMGAGKYLDVISVHPYTWPQSVENSDIEADFSHLSDLRDEYAPSAKLWATEWSYVSPVIEPERPITQKKAHETDSYGNTAIEIASYYVRSALVHLSAGFDRTYVMGSIAYGTQIYRGASMSWVDYDNSPLPAYLAWYELNHQINGFSFAEKVDVSNKYRAQIWQNGKNKKIILWRIDKQYTNIKTINSNLQVNDMFGRSFIGEIEIGPNPIYISGTSPAIDQLIQKLNQALK